MKIVHTQCVFVEARRMLPLPAAANRHASNVARFHGSRGRVTQFIALQNVFGTIQVKIGIGCRGNSET
jgi:hypothetical protein